MIRLIGDVHGHFNEYLSLAQQSQYSIQLGDFGFQYDILDKLNPKYHKVLGGNHDNYDILPFVPHNLGNYGMSCLEDLEFFFIRGAFSIDVKYRLKHMQCGASKMWWENEELAYVELLAMIEEYKEIKPSVVLTHTAPYEIIRKIGNPHILKGWGFDPNHHHPRTQMALQECFEYHQPDIWIFGHMHQSTNLVLNGTSFTCLNELEYIDI
jgi:predicted phosphodiesterase